MALSQVEEETGYNCGSLLNEQDYIQCDMNDQVITLFIVTGVPEDTPFAPQTRKEISVSARVLWVGKGLTSGIGNRVV
jgi:hypothetical protein